MTVINTKNKQHAWCIFCCSTCTQSCLLNFCWTMLDVNPKNNDPLIVLRFVVFRNASIMFLETVVIDMYSLSSLVFGPITIMSHRVRNPNWNSSQSELDINNILNKTTDENDLHTLCIVFPPINLVIFRVINSMKFPRYLV